MKTKLKTKFKLELNTANAAFGEDDPSERASEVARILRDAAKHIENGEDFRQLMDSNGNRVGFFTFCKP